MKIQNIQAPYAATIDEVVEQIQSDTDEGLGQDEVIERQLKFGKNILQKQKKKSVFLIFVSQFLDPIIYILTAAMFLAFIFQNWIEGLAVLFVIVMTALIGFFMELQAVRSVEALQKLSPAMCRVLRDSGIQKIKSSLLVPGDIILFEAGDVIPADGRIIKSNSLAIKESALTGESDQIDKTAEVLQNGISLPEQKNMVFSGTIVSRGNGRAIVTATGNHTKIGEITKLSQEAEKSRSPLEKKLRKLSRKLIWLTIILAAITALSGYLQGKDLVFMIKTGIALAVAAIPEGLPIVSTIALARGMLRLSRENVIIKNLESVETLGEVGIICTDKTGTLTENKMRVDSIILQEEKIKNSSIARDGLACSKAVKDQILKIAALCNNVGLDEHNSGDSLEAALIEFIKEQKGNVKELRNNFPRVKEIPFETERKRMITINEENEKYLFCVKGAMEAVVPHCNRVQQGNRIVPLPNKKTWMEMGEQMASEGLRTLVFAYRNDKIKRTDVGDDLVLLGILGFEDPPRKDIFKAIQTYRNAGVKVVMITGDHPKTAQKIGQEIGLLTPETTSENIVTGTDLPDLENCSKEEKSRFLKADIYARMIPEQKLQLVKFYQGNNYVVGMLGDGVNDTPALKKADIGIAMGIRGTEAAKEVADVILMDDKFTSTELAIRQGRDIFDNIRHFVIFLLSCNLAEIITVAIAAVSNLPLPLQPLQILFLNLVTDVFPALALGMGKGNKNVMKQPPRPSDEAIITPELWRSIAMYSFSIIASVIGISVYAAFYQDYSNAIINNMAFYTLILGQLLNVFNLPERKTSFIKNKVTRNLWVWGAILISLLIMVLAYWIPFLNTMLSLIPLSVNQILAVIIFGISSVILTQIIKRAGGII
ncbi:ATPase P [Christiangramia fulva]|uniref:ATPase P n=1 Tax=Christiangramia fulva TaxID=2126553 RepID=A0A2R3Z9F4_9FLAO|nr:cation-transporting P-type ATPase [Christiangramia fulva]AVR46822.1 ATPase P [Christiangramia fulva]